MDSAETGNGKKMSKIMRYKKMSEEHKSLLDNAFEANKGVLCKKLRIELIQKTGFSKKQIERYFNDKRQKVKKGSVLTQDNIADFLICADGGEEPMTVEERVEKAAEYGVPKNNVHELYHREFNPNFQRKGNVDRRKIRGEAYEKLMAAFLENEYCAEQRLTLLSESTGLEKKTITTWFQDRRGKLGMTDKNRGRKLHSQAVRIMQEFWDENGTAPKGYELEKMKRETNQSQEQIRNWFQREGKRVKKMGKM